MSFVDQTQYATGGIIGNSQAVVKRAVNYKILGLPGNKKSVYLGLGAMYLGNKDDTMASSKKRQKCHLPRAHGPIVVGEATGIPKTNATNTTQTQWRYRTIRTASRPRWHLPRCLP